MAEALLEADAVEVRYGSAAPIVRDVALRLDAGGSLGIVGESGCGKTTLARALVGWVEPCGGTVRIAGRDWSEVGAREELRRAVQMIYQDPYTSLNPRMTAIETVAEVFHVWDGLRAGAARERARALLDEVGLPRKAMELRPTRLSGGQCQRIGIARALAASPQLLVADEPTSSLDVSVQAQILNLLLELRASRGLAMVLISHDLSVVRYMTERALVMFGGRVVEEGPTAQLFSEPAHPYTRLLVESLPGRDAAPPRPVRREVAAGGCAFAGRCDRFAEPCATTVPPLAHAGARRVACLRWPQDPPSV